MWGNCRRLMVFPALLCAGAVNSEVLFPNSVVSNDIDFITATDPTVPASLVFLQRARREMPDKRRDTLHDESAYVFNVNFSDDTGFQIWAHSDFSDRDDAEIYVRKLLGPLGRIPTIFRKRLSHIVLHKGNETAFAEHLGHFFVLYSDNVVVRLDNSDLEETLFHESVHATLDAFHLENNKWSKAQEADNGYVTDYARHNPDKEDLAETALFAYTHVKHPGRLPREIENWLENNVPNRLNYIREIFFQR